MIYVVYVSKQHDLDILPVDLCIPDDFRSNEMCFLMRRPYVMYPYNKMQIYTHLRVVKSWDIGVCFNYEKYRHKHFKV